MPARRPLARAPSPPIRLEDPCRLADGSHTAPAAAALKPMFVAVPTVVCLDPEARQGVRRLVAAQAVEVEEAAVQMRERGYLRVQLPEGVTCLVPEDAKYKYRPDGGPFEGGGRV